MAGLLVLGGCSQQQTPEPPVAKVEPKVDTLFGEELVDDYFWLRGKEKPEVIEYLEAENEYTEQMMEHTTALQETLYNEMVSRIQETDLDVPERIDDYYYYTRSEEGKQYKIYCRKKGSLEAEEEILLDHNALAEGYDFHALGVFDVSPNHNLLAYGVDTTGSEEYTIHFKDLTTGELRDDQIDAVGRSFAWANDNTTCFYTILDDAHRPYQLYRHTLGTEKADDKLIHQEDDDAFWMGIGRTKSEEYLFLSMGSITSSEWRYLDADKPTGEFAILHPREEDHEYSVTHHDNRFFIVTNTDEAVNFKVMTAPVRNPSRNNWKDFIEYDPDVKIDDIEAFEDHLVVYQRATGLEQMRIYDFEDGNSHVIEMPEPVYSFSGASNPEFNTNFLRFTYYSLVTPRTVYDYNMDDKTREMKKQYEVLGDYDPDNYQSERIFATAEDGTQIPISMVYRKGMEQNGSNPTFLYGYGSYGISSDPWFSSARISLLDRGMIFAIAHVRGGGEMGRPWYEEGKLLNKMNTFTDFIACAEHLVNENYTSPTRLAINGGSAGGLLIGAVINMRPDLFHVAVANVPFVDVINTMLDESIPLTVVEFDEWGNPKEEEYFHYMKGYSPYDNVRAQDFPHLLITAGLNDPRVQYWEPAKWTAKLRANKTGNETLLLKTEMGSGHSGASGRYDYLKEVAFDWAFILDKLGMGV
ncbi:MAG: prolyl oligopeptidase family serine peptidase [candidate division Zixibacteria bacterium]|nr:prolyl oligopeptidase family serine peptidase [candidate division Zixibacteria bacterium]